VVRGVGNRGSSSPFSPGRARADLVTGLPAVGMVVGAVLGAGLGMLNPDASAVGFGGIGIAVGLVLGVFLRMAFRHD
jgi:hypothetical protein